VARLLALALAAAPTAVLAAAPVAAYPPHDAAVRLGALLFHDISLSADSRVSCAECHQPDHAFSDSKARAEGVYGLTGTRNVPSLLNVADRSTLFWDGRRNSLEDLMMDPLLGPREHGLRNSNDLVARVDADRAVRQAYADAFGAHEPVSEKGIAQSLTTYVATLRTIESPVDRYVLRKDPSALDAKEISGYELFKGRAGCSACHLIGPTSATLTDEQFHNQGIGSGYLSSNLRALVDRSLAIEPQKLGIAIQSDPEIAALGRFLVTRKPADIGAFRTPSLRSVSGTAPYMHDGSIPTLQDAVRHELYYSAADRGANFSYGELDALVAFLRALSDPDPSARGTY
jgi:cytochrome c peroxidase